MGATEEQARRSGLRLGVGHLSETRVRSDEVDPTRAEKAENSERRRQKLAGRQTDLNRDSILGSAPPRYSLAVVSSQTG